jgi:hypothetical protein
VIVLSFNRQEGSRMDSAKVDSRQLAECLKVDFDGYIKDVVAAINEAPDGRWIAGNKEQVRDLSTEFRQRVFQQALQQRIDAAEAAFSPSGRNHHRPGHQTDTHPAAEE